MKEMTTTLTNGRQAVVRLIERGETDSKGNFNYHDTDLVEITVPLVFTYAKATIMDKHPHSSLYMDGLYDTQQILNSHALAEVRQWMEENRK